jgi:hypothetical protein
VASLSSSRPIPTEYITALRTLLIQILALPSLEPSPDANFLFTSLVNLVTRHYDNADEIWRAIQDLDEHDPQRNRHRGLDLTSTTRELCSAAEAKMESFWSREIVHLCSEVSTYSPRSDDGNGNTTARMPGVRHPVHQFPYFHNYVLLSRLEISLLDSVMVPPATSDAWASSIGLLPSTDNNPKSVMFIGSGPLPLSPWMIIDDLIRNSAPGWRLTSVDIDAEANLDAHKFLSAMLGITSNHEVHRAPSLVSSIEAPNDGLITCLTSDAGLLDPSLLAAQDVVYLASLVGCAPTLTQSANSARPKEAIIAYLLQHMKPGARLLLRSADGLRRLIYQDVDESWFNKTPPPLKSGKVGEKRTRTAPEGRVEPDPSWFGSLGTLCEVEAVCHPRNEVLNSVVIVRRI